MRVGRGALLTSLLTVDADLDFKDTYQVGSLAEPATDEALRKGNKDITNAEVDDEAEIAITKLVDTYLPEKLLTARGDLLTRDADHPKRLAKGTAGHFLKQGANEPEWAASIQATQEFFIPVTYATELTESVYAHPGGIINAVADKAFIEFYVPHDFSSIIEAVVARHSNATATHRLNYVSKYAALTEVANLHLETLADQDTAETVGVVYEQDISGILASLATGDHVSIKVLGDNTNTPNDCILGVRFKYS